MSLVCLERLAIVALGYVDETFANLLVGALRARLILGTNHLTDDQRILRQALQRVEVDTAIIHDRQHVGLVVVTARLG